jgi:hypothetical protein
VSSAVLHACMHIVCAMLAVGVRGGPWDRQSHMCTRYDRCGKLCVEYTLMHRHAASALPAGEGRQEPNINPKLPEPTRESMLCMLNPVNLLTGPCKILIDLIGPNFLRQLCCLGVCAALVFMLVLVVPQIVGDIIVKIFD